MPHRDDTKRTEKTAELPELNKETLRDLDVEPVDAKTVKGGGIGTLVTTGRTAKQP
jgi:hypothetical protein